MSLTEFFRFSKVAQQAKSENLFSEKPEDGSSNKPSPEKLAYVHKLLTEQLSKLFIQVLDYSIYHENIIFEDHIRNIRTE